MNHAPDNLEPQEELKLEEPTSQFVPRPWVTPTFERVPLNEALDNPGSGSDFNGRAS